MLPVIWVTCAIVIVSSAVRARRHPSALRTGRLGVGFLFLVAGAAVNGFFVLRGDDYVAFADGSPVAFVRDTWASVVVPHHDAWITLLVVFEVAVGVLALSGGRRTQLAYLAAIAFHVALLSFGWGFFLWSLPMISALVALLVFERRVGAEADVVDVSAPVLYDADRVDELLHGDAGVLLGPGRRHDIRVGAWRGSIAHEARIELTDPVGDDDEWRVTIEPEGARHLFPSFDGRLTVVDASDGGRARLRLAGTCRPPLGFVGAVGDAVVGHHLARRSLVDFLSTAAARCDRAIDLRQDVRRPAPYAPDLRDDRSR